MFLQTNRKADVLSNAALLRLTSRKYRRCYEERITPLQATSLKLPERGKGMSGKKEKVIHSLSDFATSGLAFYLCDV